jgi:ubiquinone/menaquinone biosynthesis C-methylase UbiE
MPWKYSEEYYREYTRTTWNEAAPAYPSLAERFVPFRAELVRQLGPAAGESILDLGTGHGEPAMTIAGAVGATGRVVGVDLSEGMVDLAGRTARERHLSNMEFRVMDCSALDFPDASFDGVVSSFGFQIFTDPAKAAREARRVLRPGGRIAVSIWSTAEKVPFLDVLVAPMMAGAEPDETGYLPTPFETGGPGEMAGFLREAGFQSPSERRLSLQFIFHSPEEYLDTVLRGTPLGHSLGEESPETQETILRATRANLEGRRSGTEIVLPAEAVFVTARA